MAISQAATTSGHAVLCDSEIDQSRQWFMLTMLSDNAEQMARMAF